MASIGSNIKKIRKQKGLLQKEVASTADMQASSYSKTESGQRDVSVEALDKIAQLFRITVDEIIHHGGSKIPTPVIVEDKAAIEKIQLIS